MEAFFSFHAREPGQADLERCAVGCLSASFFAVSHDLASSAKTFQHVGAGLLLAVSFLGWYIFLALVLLSVDFPYILPLGDLSTVIPGRTDRTRESCDKA